MLAQLAVGLDFFLDSIPAEFQTKISDEDVSMLASKVLTARLCDRCLALNVVHSFETVVHSFDFHPMYGRLGCNCQGVMHCLHHNSHLRFRGQCRLHVFFL
jgi:hypothetical protein